MSNEVVLAHPLPASFGACGLCAGLVYSPGTERRRPTRARRMSNQWEAQIVQWILLFAAVIAVYLYILAPLQVRAKLRWSTDPVFEPVRPGDARIPAEVRAFWSEAVPPLQAIGFTPTACLTSLNLMPNSALYIALLENRATGDEAAAYVVITQAPSVPAKRAYNVEFSTEYADGSSICTNNSDELPTGYPAPWRTTARIPRLADADQLYQVHQALTARHGGSQRPLTPPGAHVEKTRASLLREYQAWIDAGCLYRDDQQHQLRQTLTGAYAATWGQLWPVSSIRRWRMSQRARRLLRDAGLPVNYPTVDYQRVVYERVTEGAAAVAAPGLEPAATSLQFDRAEYAEPSQEPAGPRCTACRRPLADSYYEVNGQVTCPDCQLVAVHEATGGSRVGRTFRAGLAGAAGGGVGALIYFAVEVFTGYQIGLIALLVGFLVGAGVRWGAHGRGGWFYQIMAIALTYAAIAESYALMAVRDVVRDPSVLERLATKSTAPTSPQAGAETTSSPTSSATAPVAPAPPLTVAGFVLGLGLLLLLSLALPVMVGIESPIALLIFGIALFEAWKLNKRRAARISGPYAVAAIAAPGETRQSPPTPPPPEGHDHG
jgi:hypothetical protein